MGKPELILADEAVELMRESASKNTTFTHVSSHGKPRRRWWQLTPTTALLCWLAVWCRWVSEGGPAHIWAMLMTAFLVGLSAARRRDGLRGLG